MYSTFCKTFEIKNQSNCCSTLNACLTCSAVHKLLHNTARVSWLSANSARLYDLCTQPPLPVTLIYCTVCVTGPDDAKICYVWKQTNM